MLKILNLYAGIGGNRRHWSGDIHVTAVEHDPVIAGIYKDMFPDDDVVIGDAHAFLLKNFTRFDFIWSSPPCITHTRLVRCRMGKISRSETGARYPDMRLYEEILLLKHFFKGCWVVENVISYYKPLIKPFKIQRHYFWSDFVIPDIMLENDNIARGTLKELEKRHCISLDKYPVTRGKKERMLRNCVTPELGKHIFSCAFKIKQVDLFDNSIAPGPSKASGAGE